MKNEDDNFSHQMSPKKSYFWYSNNCLHFLNPSVPLGFNTWYMANKLVCFVYYTQGLFVLPSSIKLKEGAPQY